mmetsp:Transcript_9346/g.13271  ORF Transcript_9346/g.13271 Transcript_9346/m.13271 type:complete len:486 (+) Transcript_9346:69-1526(+)
MMIRREIGRRLAAYYAQPCHKVVGSLGTNILHEFNLNNDNTTTHIQFKRLLGEWHWKRIYRQLYDRQEGQWLTPVELFRPYYSQILANFIACETLEAVTNGNMNNNSVQVVELGGGRGTNALEILSYLKHTYPSIYERIDKYIIVDSSPTLLDLQRNILIGERYENDRNSISSSRTSLFRDKVSLVPMDLMDVAENKNSDFLDPSSVHTITISLELLDNLPHDKIKRCETTGTILQAELIPSFSTTPTNHNHTNNNETKQTNNQMIESFVPLHDPLLTQIINHAPSYVAHLGNHPTSMARWIPSVACGVLQTLYQQRPNSSLLLADFDALPPPTFNSSSIVDKESCTAEGEPLFTDMKDTDHACLLTSPPFCDILFPTDFPRLAEFVNNILHQQERITTKGNTRYKDSANHDDHKDQQQKSISETNGFRTLIRKQSDFLLDFGPCQIEATKSFLTGYSPMISDFSNCSVLTVSRSVELPSSSIIK